MLVKKPENEKILNVKAVTSVSRKGVIGLMTLAIVSYLMEFVFDEGGLFVIPKWLKWTIYVLYATLNVILGVDKPEMKKFVAIVQEALSDKKITLEEAMAIIRQGFFVFMGFWADISQIENKEQKEKKVDEQKAVEIATLKAEIEALQNQKSNTSP